MTAQDLARELLATMNASDVEAELALYAPDAVLHHPLADRPLEGRDAIRASEQQLWAAFTDVQVQERTILSSGSTVAVELVLMATNSGPLTLGPGQQLPASGRHIELPCVWVLDIGDDDLIAVERDYFDTALLFRQLGLQE